MLKSKIAAGAALFIIVLVVVITLAMQVSWWWFIAEFFIFMAAEAHFAALLVGNKSAEASRKLDNCALICGILAVAAFITLYIIFQIDL